MVQMVQPVGAVCPHCGGFLPSCTFTTDNKCPTVDIPAQNLQVMAGTAAAGATLMLTNLISLRFLRMFSRQQLLAAQALARRPAPGTVFEITATMGLQKILQAVSTGQVTMEQATMALATFIDAEPGDSDASKAKKADLRETYKLLVSTKEIKGYTNQGAAPGEAGIWSWLWGTITNFVSERGMQTKVSVDTGTSSAPPPSSVFSTTIKRFKDPWDFMESLNLLILFATSLGMCSVVLLTEFLEHTVYDTIRMRGKPWQMAFELLVIMLRRIEDSAGKLTLGNCINDTYLNTVMEEAFANCQRLYPDVLFFRAHPGKGGNGNSTTGGGTKWNGKFTNAKDAGLCQAFNGGREHLPHELHPDGTCRRNHVCDKWVTNKGPGGKCLCSEGTPGHARIACDNPHRSDTKQQ